LPNKVLAENLNVSANSQISNSEENVNTVFTEDNANLSQKIDEIKSPYQTKPRRRVINFPDDCQRSVAEGSKNWKLVSACAEALESIKSKVRKVAENNDCSHPFNEVISYLVKKDDVRRIDAIAQKLGTTVDNILENSDITDPNNLQEGQLLQYVEIHYLYEQESTFYSLSANKYLVELRCWNAAYNLSNIYLMYDESELPAKVNILEFPSLDFEYPDDENPDIPKAVKEVSVKAVGGRHFNPKTKELIVFVKSRGMGDAGKYARYSFPNDNPKLEEFRAKFAWTGRGYDTNDIIKNPPKTWKRYYPK
jgi:hypothetical protein